MATAEVTTNIFGITGKTRAGEEITLGLKQKSRVQFCRLSNDDYLMTVTESRYRLVEGEVRGRYARSVSFVLSPAQFAESFAVVEDKRKD